MTLESRAQTLRPLRPLVNLKPKWSKTRRKTSVLLAGGLLRRSRQSGGCGLPVSGFTNTSWSWNCAGSDLPRGTALGPRASLQRAIHYLPRLPTTRASQRAAPGSIYYFSALATARQRVVLVVPFIGNRTTSNGPQKGRVNYKTIH